MNPNSDAGRDAYRRELQPLLDELQRAGLSVHRAAELRRYGARCEPFARQIVETLERASSRELREELVSVLAAPWARAAALRPMIELFKTTPNSPPATKATIARAIEVLADASVESELVELATTRSHGNARESVVLALGKLDGPAVFDALIGLLGERGVGGHALTALARVVARRRIYVDPQLVKPFLRDGRAWVRREAKDLLQTLASLG